MSRFARTIRIGAPAPEIWPALVDVETWPTWATQFKRINRLDTGPLGVGSNVRVTPKGMLAAVWQVTDFVEGRSFTWAASLAPGVRLVGGHVLTPDDDGTKAEFWLEASGPVGRLFNPLLRLTIFNRNTRNATEGLKAYVEARARSAEH